MQSRFEFQVKKMAQLIELQKNFMKSNQVGQVVLQYQRDIFRRKVEKNYPLLVQLMIECHSYVAKCTDGPGRIELNDPDKQRDVDQYLQDAAANIADTCKECVSDYSLLPKYAFEVRKQDTTPTKSITKQFIKDYLDNPFIYDIIENNNWDP